MTYRMRHLGATLWTLIVTLTAAADTGETLTSDTLEISDENDLERVHFHYQWISSDGTTDTDIEGAPGRAARSPGTRPGTASRYVCPSGPTTTGGRRS